MRFRLVNNDPVDAPQPNLKHKESAPIESTHPKFDIPPQKAPIANSPQPTTQSSPNFANTMPLQMPMHPGMVPNMMQMSPNQNMQMPYMGQMVMMPTQMGMMPAPFMMPPHMNQPNFNQFNPTANYANNKPAGNDVKGGQTQPRAQPVVQNK